MNPEKVYLADTGFSLLTLSGSDNRGKLLKTAVAGEFFRRGLRTCYYKGKKECDFIVRQEVVRFPQSQAIPIEVHLISLK